jgi:hypothetical protein
MRLAISRQAQSGRKIVSVPDNFSVLIERVGGIASADIGIGGRRWRPLPGGSGLIVPVPI